MTDGYATLRALFESLLNPRGYGLEDVTGMSVTILGTRPMPFIDGDTYEVAPAALPTLLDMALDEIEFVLGHRGG